MRELFPTFARAGEFLFELLSLEMSYVLLLLDPRFWLGVYRAKR